jgi:hypothetical protein
VRRWRNGTREGTARSAASDSREYRTSAICRRRSTRAASAISGALIAKQHVDTPCDSLIKLYQKIAAENEALANAHKAMAKEAK